MISSNTSRRVEFIKVSYDKRELKTNEDVDHYIETLEREVQRAN